MSVPSPLGSLTHIRILHDNMGEPPLDSWQLETVVVRDLQNCEKYVFEARCWLALNRGDGKIDRVFTPVNNLDEKTFSQEMYVRSNKTANQDHMWMSIFVRPVYSRFGRKERISVCAAFLYLSMLMSALWYQRSGESARKGFFDLGPVTITMEQFFIGLCIMGIVYPFTMFLSIIFKRARPRQLKRCRAIDSFENQRKDRLLDIGKDEDIADKESQLEKLQYFRPKDTSKALCLPWWTRWLAWVLVFASIGGAAFLVWSYGIMWGEVKTCKWFSSFIFSFLLSVIITQWIKVLVLSLFSSLCCKTDLSTEDIDCDEELPGLKPDQQWLDMKQQKGDQRRVYTMQGVDNDDPEVSAVSTRLKKEKEIGLVMKEIWAYCLFLAVLFILVNDKVEIKNYLLKTQLVNAFIRSPYPEFDYSKVKTTNDWWLWSQNVILQKLRAQRNYNNDPPYGLKGFLNDQANRIIGYAIIRQIRILPFACVPPVQIQQVIYSCSGTRDITLEDTFDYCAGWNHEETFRGACDLPEFQYRNATELQTYNLWGRLGWYSGGGYVMRLSGSQNDLLDRLKYLQKIQWIDMYTRATVLEFSTYTPNANLFSINRVIAEFNEGGGVLAKWTFEPLRLLKDNSFYSKIVTLCEFIFVATTAIFTINELWKIKKEKCSYFSSYWNMAELCILLVSYSLIGVYAYRYMLTKQALDIFNVTYGNGYVRMDSAAFMDQIYVYCLSVIMFFSLLKLIKLLQFNKRMDVLALTIKKCWDELKIFFIAFGIVFFAFSLLFFLMFTASLLDFAAIHSAIITSFTMMMGKFDFKSMNEVNPISPLLFFIFSIVNAMILINIMLTIILQAFGEVKQELLHKENRLNILDYVGSSFRQFLRKEDLHRINVHPVFDDKKEIKEEELNVGEDYEHRLSEKVNDLIQYITNTYFDGRLNVSEEIAKKNSDENKTNIDDEGKNVPYSHMRKGVYSTE